MAESRLSRRSVRQSKKQLYTSPILIVVVLAVVINFGPFLIARVGELIDTISGKGNQNVKIVTDDDLKAPTLSPLPSATRSLTINVSGNSFYSEGEIVLVLNGEEYETVELNDTQEFQFENVRLKEGENVLKVRIVQGKKESDYSDEKTINFSKGEPKLEVGFPTDQQSFSKTDKTIIARGSTDPENTVEVNGFIAIVDTSGNFSQQINLNNGENKLKITAKNPAGAEISKEITVSYSE